MTAEMGITEEELRASLYAGDAQRTFALLAPHPSSELKQFQKVLKEIRAEHRQLERDNWNASLRLGGPLVAAGVLCSDTPAQAAQWLRRELLYHFERTTLDPEDVLDRRHDAAWLGELALRLVEKLRPENDHSLWSLTNELAVRSGARLPLSPAYIHGWLYAARYAYRARERGTSPRMLTGWLREQPRLRECIEAVFATDNAGGDFNDFPGSDLPEEDKWPRAIATMIAEGRLDRAEVLDACAARLLRGDRPGSLRGFLTVHEELAPTRAEVRERLGTYQGMATAGAGTVAKMALRELRALDAEEPFEPTDFASLSEAVLGRAESGLAGGQLAWLDAALKRDPGTCAILLPCLGAAFTHPATSVQQRALKLVGKYLGAADREIVSGLRDAAMSVDPALKAEADSVFAAYVAADVGDEPVPVSGGPLPPYQPSALPPMPSTPEELVTALAPSYAEGRISPLEAEQIMASVAALAHHDVSALAKVFQPLYDRYDDDLHRRPLYPDQLWEFPTALRCLLEAVLGKDRRKKRVQVFDAADTQPKAAIVLRIQELTDQLLKRKTVPVLLATPTEPSGAIDPAVLEARLARYRELRIKPLPLDLEHAWLRAAADPARTKALAELPVDALFSSDHATGRPLANPRPSQSGGLRGRSVFGFRTGLTINQILLLPNLVKDDTLNFPQPPDLWASDPQYEFASIMLPHDPDLVAAFVLTKLCNQANDLDARTPSPSVFPALAETAGVPGVATHLALVYALAADSLEHRIAAQDAVLTFAARGLLRPELLGRLAAIAWQRDFVRGKRIIDALGQIEEAGASAEIFAATAAMLAPLSKKPEIRGLPEVLLLATRAAVGAGMRNVEVPGLAALADVAKPKRVGVEARRLREAITVAS